MSENGQTYRWERLSRIAAVVFLVLGICAFPFAIRTTVDNRMELFLGRDPKANEQYEQFRKAFGTDEFVVAAYTGKDLFTLESLDVQVKTFEQLQKVKFVKRVSGLPQVFSEVFGGEDVEELKKDFLATPFYHGFLISKDGTVGSLLMEMDRPGGIEDRRKLIEDVSAALQPLRDYGFQVHLVGPPALHITMEDISQRESRRTFPIALVFSLVIMGYLFRSAKAMIISLLCTGLTVLLVVGLMVVVHRPLNMVTSVLPVMLCVLSTETMIHLLRRYQDWRAETPSIQEAINRAVSQKALACILSSMTKAFGFLSLCITDMVPILELGIFAAVGLVVSVSVNMTVGPLLIEWLRVGPRVRKHVTPMRTAAFVGRFSQRYARIIFAITAILVVIMIASLVKIRVESNTLTFLPQDSETVQSYNFVGQKLTGLFSLEIVASMPSGWLDSKNWPAIEELTRKLGAEAGVARVVSPLDLLRKLNQWDHDFDPQFYVLPESSEVAQRLVGELDETGQSEITRLVADEGKTIRISVLVRDTDSSRFMEIEKDAEALIAKLPANITAYPTGIVLQMAKTQLNLVWMQVSTLSIAFITVFLVILVGLRSLRYSLIAFIPNLFPILSVFGVMVAFNLALDPATVMVASIALGVGGNNAIHLMGMYMLVRKQGKSTPEAIPEALGIVLPASLTAASTSCIGFIVLAWSAFIPIHYFGILSAFAVIVALVGDMILVPACLTFFADDMRAEKKSKTAVA
ncbi:MAG TPA: MMPL family transporter [Candidatus Hydrogenedentes bacterium]|nr:MMPL family transporter [Candidatus Hydrogenedentota bacterium]